MQLQQKGWLQAQGLLCLEGCRGGIWSWASALCLLRSVWVGGGDGAGLREGSRRIPGRCF